MSAKSASAPSPHAPAPVLREDGIEYGFIGKLQGLKYEYRPDIRDRAALEANFRHRFEVLNRVNLTDSEFARLLDEIITPDVFAASRRQHHQTHSGERVENVAGACSRLARTTPHRRLPFLARRPDRRRDAKARRPPAPQARPYAAAFPIPGGGMKDGQIPSLILP